MSVTAWNNVLTIFSDSGQVGYSPSVWIDQIPTASVDFLLMVSGIGCFVSTMITLLVSPHLSGFGI